MELMADVLSDRSLGAILFVSVIKASLFLALAQTIVNALPRLSAATKHFLLGAAIGSFLIVPGLSLVGPSWQIAFEVAPPPRVSNQVAETKASMTDAAPPSAQARDVASELASDFDLAGVGAALWFIGALAVILRFVASALRVRRAAANATAPSDRLSTLLVHACRTLSLTAPVRLLLCDHLAVPTVWGIHAGTLLLPRAAESWNDEQVRATFIHELGHLQRRDVLSLGVMNLVAALLWFDPQIWIARRRALIEGERACDDLVLLAGTRPSEYASHLLNVAGMASRRDPIGATLAMARPSQIEGRMKSILSTSTNRRSIGRTLLMTLIALFLGLLLPLSALQLTAETAPVAPVVAKRAVRTNAAPSAPKPVTPTPKVAAPVVSTAVAASSSAKGAIAPAAVPAMSETPAVAPIAAVDAVTEAAPEAPVMAVPIVEVPPSVEPRAEGSNLTPRPADAPKTPPSAAPPAKRPVVTPRPSDAPNVSPPAAPPEDRPIVTPRPMDAPKVSPPAAPITPVPNVAVLSRSEVERPFFTLKNVQGRVCTMKLNRPVNTGDPMSNPAEQLALRRLLTDAGKHGADAVVDLKCVREIFIGFACPTAVKCEAKAVTFTAVSNPKA